MKQQERVKLPAVGGSSLLVIFAVLCLTVFALLGLSTAQAAMRLSDAAAEAVSDYYAADAAAEAILADLRQHHSTGTFRFTCPVSDRQVLSVTVCLEGSDYEILQWQMLSTAQWEADDTINLWDGTVGP